MKTNIVISLFAVMLLVGCGEDAILSSSNDDTDSNTSVEVKETVEATQTSEVDFHHQGELCLNCHTSSGSLSSQYLSDAYDDDNDDDDNENDESDELDSDDMFTSGATVYTAIDGTLSSTFATGYRIRLVLENTDEVITYSIDEGDGNSYTEYSNSINNYTAQVVNSNNEVVNSSVLNSHGVDRLDCNRCHSATGSEGAPGRITSYDYYATNSVDTTEVNTTTTNTDLNSTTLTDTNTTVAITAAVSFATDVMSALTSKCVGCHGSNGNFTITDSASTYTNITVNDFVNTTSVDSSALLVKSSGGDGVHLPILTTNSTEYLTLKEWITEGAQNN